MSARNHNYEKEILKKIGPEKIMEFAKAYEELCRKYGLRIAPTSEYWPELGVEVNFIDDYFENFLYEVQKICERIK